MMKNAYSTLEDIEPEHRQFYVQQGSMFVIMRELEDLQAQYNEVEASHATEMAKKDKRLTISSRKA